MDIDKLQKAVTLELIHVKDSDIAKLGVISETLVFDNMHNFHPDGLFSTTIFGALGSEHRNRIFGVINTKLSLIHPLIYYCIITLKSYYKQIMDGTTLVVFNPITKEFDKDSSNPKAKTGYAYFIKHVHELKFTKSDSDRRNFMIDLFNKAVKEKKVLMQYLLVLPAGLRDYKVDANGKPEEDEVNSYYRRILSMTAIVDALAAKKDISVYDHISTGVQKTLLELFDYLTSLLEGKHKLILGKWLSRKVYNSTRNVLSNHVNKRNHIKDPLRLNLNDCIMGLHQFLRATVPLSFYHIKNKYIPTIFPENSNVAYLTNITTFKKEEVRSISIEKEYDAWTSSEGLFKVIAKLGNLNNRNDPILLNKGKHALGLVYRDDKCFKFIQDIDEVPDHYDRSRVSIVTLTEFLYMSTYELNGQVPGFITRYPITGYGSIFPANAKFMTTILSDTLNELDSEWLPSTIATCFPIKDSDYYNSFSVHNSHLGALGGDHDGDTISFIAVLSDESKEEVKKTLNSREYYIGDNGMFYFSSETDTMSAVLNYMTA